MEHEENLDFLLRMIVPLSGVQTDDDLQTSPIPTATPTNDNSVRSDHTNFLNYCIA